MSTVFERVWRKSVSWRPNPTPSSKSHLPGGPDSVGFIGATRHAGIPPVEPPTSQLEATGTSRFISSDGSDCGGVVTGAPRRSGLLEHILPEQLSPGVDARGICAMHKLRETNLQTAPSKVHETAAASTFRGRPRQKQYNPDGCDGTSEVRARRMAETQHRLYLRRMQGVVSCGPSAERRRLPGIILIPKRLYYSTGRSFRPLRPPDEISGGALARRPGMSSGPPARAELIESLRVPSSVAFFAQQTIGCRCKNCSASLCRRWNIRNGMPCLNTLPVSFVPPSRPRLPLQPRSRHDISALERCIPTAASPGEFFDQRQPARSSRVLKSARTITPPVQNSPRRGSEPAAGSSPTATTSSPITRRPLMRGSVEWTAEVVLIGSSLESTRHCFHDGERVMHFFNCKGVEFFFVDLNADIGVDRADLHLVKRWRHLHWIHRDHSKSSDQKRDIVAPQVFIDGVAVGSYNELMDLDEDNDLDYILSKRACPNCLFERTAAVGRPPKLKPDGSRQESVGISADAGFASGLPIDYCQKCGAVFRELVNSEILPVPEALDAFIRQNHHSCRQYLGLPNIRGSNIADTDWNCTERDLALVQLLARAARYRETLIVELPGD